MSSLVKNASGSYRLQIVWKDGRPSIPLPGANKKQAEKFQIRFDHFLGTAVSGIDHHTAEWLQGLPDKTYDKMVSLGMVEPKKEAKADSLKPFTDWYIETRSVGVKHSTTLPWGHAQGDLVDYFGEDKLIQDITHGQAELWRLDMMKEESDPSKKTKKKYAKATLNKRCKLAKQFFDFAIKHKLIDENPFSDLDTSSVANEDRLYFVPWDDYEKVLSECPDDQWRAIFGIPRIQGTRTPSETLNILWDDIDFANNLLTVRSPKTARYEGKGYRVMPLFPEIRDILLRLWEQAKPGDKYVITRYRTSEANLRTQANRIIKRAGLEPWPKPFQNLRATRATELVDRFGSETARIWLGNSVQVIRKHYYSVPEEHIQRAIAEPTCAESVQSRAKSVQQSSARDSKGDISRNENGYKSLKKQIPASLCNHLQESLVVPRGFEPLLPG